jgi:hypothetical protein
MQMNIILIFQVARVDFSEPQGGKGSCDRKAANIIRGRTLNGVLLHPAMSNLNLGTFDRHFRPRDMRA